ncbi:dUTP diphosphatase [Paenibacillus sp. YIM B09110]|uniref:dUTP diphosphatase n=1 Tax=Paenibacillus sp. YIM B09110 TaxID=3126102 RepID=UPI00301DCFE9
MTQLNVKVRKLTPAATLPTYATEGAAGFDLYAAADVIIAPGETALVPLGLTFEIPAGFEMQLRPRSGVTRDTKLRVANSPGTIDEDYRGEVSVIVDNIAAVSEYRTINYELLDETKQPTELRTRYGYGDQEYREYDKIPYHSYIIRTGDRIAQGVIAPVTRVSFTETDEKLTQTTRGDGGFGHSGVRAEVSE